jgi:hypothetical protein
MIYPMFAMVLLTFAVLVKVFRSRVRAVREGKVSAAYFRIYQGEAEPESTAKPARHFANLFEAPVLFYVVCLAAMITHAWVHLGGNRLRKRIRAYFFSWLVLLSMWIYLVVGISLGT